MYSYNERLQAVELYVRLGKRLKAVIRESYPDFGPTLAAEKLRELHLIRTGKETVRKLRVDAVLWIARPCAPQRSTSRATGVSVWSN